MLGHKNLAVGDVPGWCMASDSSYLSVELSVLLLHASNGFQFSGNYRVTL